MNPTWPLISVSPPSLSLCSSQVFRSRCSSSVSRNFTASLSRRVNLHSRKCRKFIQHLRKVRKFGLVLSKRRSGLNLKPQGSTLFDTTQLVLAHEGIYAALSL
ncbi:hypothetical protein P8452_46416 [Trifolium repens]|nr:hypothetical protein P8452_46416 [Trifolium repens]